MEKELAKKLRDAGFPEVTRWGAENNVHRYHSMDADGTSFPEIGELIAEINILTKRQEWGLISSKDWDGTYTCYDGSAEGYWAHETNGKTPEDALGKMWLELKSPLIRT